MQKFTWGSLIRLGREIILSPWHVPRGKEQEEGWVRSLRTIWKTESMAVVKIMPQRVLDIHGRVPFVFSFRLRPVHLFSATRPKGFSSLCTRLWNTLVTLAFYEQIAPNIIRTHVSLFLTSTYSLRNFRINSPFSFQLARSVELQVLFIEDVWLDIKLST